MPGKIAYLLASFMEKRGTKNGKAPALTTFAVWNLMRNNKFDSTKAKTELGYTTRPYQDTIHDQVVWMKSAGLIR